MFFDTLIFMLLQTLKMFYDRILFLSEIYVLLWVVFLYTIFCKSFAISGLFQFSVKRQGEMADA